MTRTEKTRKRILRFLSQGEAGLADAAIGEMVLLDAEGRGTVSADRSLLAAMIREGQLQMNKGKIALARSRNPDGGNSHAKSSPDGNRRDIEVITLETEAGPQEVAVNWSESPLGQLMRRRGKDGEPFLSVGEFQAGERLRSDYARGQIMPRLGANWEASVSSGRRSGGVAELTEAALAARIRVEKAIRAVGPELSGVLIDVCCFLKGMETVEVERGWPVRSAKIVLKSALGALSRHYNPQAAQRPRHMLHWGAADYRPSIGS